MARAETEIINKLGLHARASAKLTQLAGKFDCDIWMEKGSRRINAKSIMGVLMLAAGVGTTVHVRVNGEDEVACMDAIEALFNRYFDEGS